MTDNKNIMIIGIVAIVIALAALTVGFMAMRKVSENKMIGDGNKADEGKTNDPETETEETEKSK